MKFKKSLASVLSTAILVPSVFNPCSAKVNNESEKSNQSNGTYKSAQNSDKSSPLMEFSFGGGRIDSGCDTSKIKLDLFEDDNLDVALKHGLEFIINDEISPYIDDKEPIVKGIRENRLIGESLQSTINYIKTKKENDNDKNLEIFKRLHTIEAMIKSDNGVPDDNTALRFISAMKSAYQMVISRSVAKSILEDNREKIESKMGSETQSSSAELSSSVPAEGFNVGLCAGMGTSQQSTETSFYKIDNSGTLGLSVGTGLQNYLSANAECAFGITNSLIFYSLEEYFDTGMDKGNISFLKLKDEDLKKVISSRKNMQKTEDATIVKLKTSIEPFLKSANIVPQNLAFKMPEPTYFGTPERSRELSISTKLAAEASCLLKAGMNVSTDVSVTKIKSYHPYLALIDENFLITDYCTDIDDLTTYLKVSNTSKYKEVTQAVTSSAPDVNKTELLSIMVSNLTNDLKRYNIALATMADDNTDDKTKSDARNVKKNMEKNWIGGKFSSGNNHSRESMLKVAISVGAYLRSLSQAGEEGKLFSSLYNEVQNLSLLQKFTNKLFFKTQQGFDTSRTSNKVAITGETYLDIPFVGKTNLTVSRSDTESPLYTENSQDIIVTTQLPTINGKLYGTETLKDKLNDLIRKISGMNNNAAQTLSDSLNIVGKEFDNIASSYGIDKTLFVPTVFSMKDYVNLHFYLTKIPKTEQPNELIPLPDNKIIEKDKDTVILKLTKRIDSLNKNLTIRPDAVSLKASNKVGKASSKVGPDSLIFTTNKFNTCELGKNLTGSGDLWNRFKQGQKDSLNKLFANMTENDSNAKYELQNMYSLIIKNIKSKSELSSTEQSSLISTAENMFRRFLYACEELKESKDDDSATQSYETASHLLDSILKLNYEFVWHPALIAANNK